jgi:hypothetical protein
MKAPMITSTMSQWLASIAMSMGLRLCRSKGLGIENNEVWHDCHAVHTLLTTRSDWNGGALDRWPEDLAREECQGSGSSWDAWHIGPGGVKPAGV